MDIQFQALHVSESLILMLMGMVGIFVVMGVILGAIVLLNKITVPKNDDEKNLNKK